MQKGYTDSITKYQRKYGKKPKEVSALLILFVVVVVFILI